MPYSHPTLQVRGSLKNQQLTATVKSSRQAAIRGDRTLSEPLSQRNGAPWKTPLAMLSSLDLPLSSPCLKSLFPKGTCPKKLRGNHLTLWLTEAINKVEAKYKLRQKFRRKIWRIRCSRASKNCDIFLGIQTFVHMWKAVCTPKVVYMLRKDLRSPKAVTSG